MTRWLRRVLAGRVTLATYAFLVVPFALGWFRTSLLSPLALPGYLLFVIGTAVGEAIAPRFQFWIYWAPFLVCCYGAAAIVGLAYEVARR